jgi:hypothetical protein
MEIIWLEIGTYLAKGKEADVCELFLLTGFESGLVDKLVVCFELSLLFVLFV